MALLNDNNLPLINFLMLRDLAGLYQMYSIMKNREFVDNKVLWMDLANGH